jgi:hypothetical protein
VHEHDGGPSVSRYTPPKERARTRVRLRYAPDTGAGSFPGLPQAMVPPKPFLRKGVDPSKFKPKDVVGSVLSFDGGGQYTVEIDDAELPTILEEFGLSARVLG